MPACLLFDIQKSVRSGREFSKEPVCLCALKSLEKMDYIAGAGAALAGSVLVLPGRDHHDQFLQLGNGARASGGIKPGRNTAGRL